MAVYILVVFDWRSYFELRPDFLGCQIWAWAGYCVPAGYFVHDCIIESLLSSQMQHLGLGHPFSLNDMKGLWSFPLTDMKCLFLLFVWMIRSICPYFFFGREEMFVIPCYMDDMKYLLLLFRWIIWCVCCSFFFERYEVLVILSLSTIWSVCSSFSFERNEVLVTLSLWTISSVCSLFSFERYEVFVTLFLWAVWSACSSSCPG
jgi:hypothetical protein